MAEPPSEPPPLPPPVGNPGADAQLADDGMSSVTSAERAAREQELLASTNVEWRQAVPTGLTLDDATEL